MVHTGGVQRVVVVGAGVVGLTCALRLLQAGHRVDVVARDLPLETTSVVAAALWYPYRAGPQERVSGWAATSREELVALAAADPDGERTGVRVVVGTEVLRAATPDPWWAGAVPDLSRPTAADLPAGFVDGYRFAAPVVEMPRYLRWLRREVLAAGGSLTRLALSSLPGSGPHAALVVDCAGLGARLLAGDLAVTPVRGQVVRVARTGVDRWWLDGAGPTYVVPRADDVVVGGTAEEGVWDRTPSPATAARLLERAEALVPGISAAPVLGHAVGLRPARPHVRLERVGDVVHCYGHGGAGVTLSWGCADEVAALV